MLRFFRLLMVPVLGLSLGACSLLPGARDAESAAGSSRSAKVRALPPAAVGQGSAALPRLVNNRPPPVLLTRPQMPVPERRGSPAPTPEPIAQAPAPVPPIPVVDSRSPSGYFLPSGLFGDVLKLSYDMVRAPGDETALPLAAPSAVKSGAPAQARNAAAEMALPVAAPAQRVQRSSATEAGDFPVALGPADSLRLGIFVSRTSQEFYAAGGIDYLEQIVMPWLGFCKRNDLICSQVQQPAELAAPNFDVLIVPSAVALNNAEKDLLAKFRARGGNLLTTWLSGVRDELGQWQGFAFMQDVLDVRVLGSTASKPLDVFFMPFGDTPVSHQLPAGQRIWLEQVTDWYPLRLSGANPAGAIMNWGRSVDSSKPATLIVFDERASGSRSVVVGFPERLWISTDIVAIDKVLIDASRWLARRPDAYVSQWPDGHLGAAMLAVDIPDTMVQGDAKFLDLAAKLGTRASFFLLTNSLEDAPKDLLARMAADHEIGLHGDSYEDFKGQRERDQKKRVRAMLRRVGSLDIELKPPFGFHAPMDSFDETTLSLLAESDFSYLVADNGVTDDALPKSFKLDGKAMTYLPRVLRSPDVIREELAGSDESLSLFANELANSVAMNGLSLIQLSQTTSFNVAQLGQILTPALRQPAGPWLASGHQIVKWWQARERVRAWMDHAVSPPLLTVEVAEGDPLDQPVAILLNAARSNNRDGAVRLVQDTADQQSFTPSPRRLDRWRYSASLQGIRPGRYHWFVVSDAPAARGR